jgi:hypothetical protein
VLAFVWNNVGRFVDEKQLFQALLEVLKNQ